MVAGPIGEAARKGDYDEVLKQALVKVADALDATDSGRDVSSLAIKVADLVDRCEQRGDAKPKTRQKLAEVTAFETIAGRRPKRKQAAEG